MAVLLFYSEHTDMNNIWVLLLHPLSLLCSLYLSFFLSSLVHIPATSFSFRRWKGLFSLWWRGCLDAAAFSPQEQPPTKELLK